MSTEIGLVLVGLVAIFSVALLVCAVLFFADLRRLTGGDTWRHIRDKLRNLSSVPGLFSLFWTVLILSLVLLEFSFVACSLDASLDTGVIHLIALVLSAVSLIIFCRAAYCYSGAPPHDRLLLSIPLLSIVSLGATAGGCFCLMLHDPVLGGAGFCLIVSLLCGALTARLGSYHVTITGIMKRLRDFLTNFGDLSPIHGAFDDCARDLRDWSADLARIADLWRPLIPPLRPPNPNFVYDIPDILAPPIETLVQRQVAHRGAAAMADLTEQLRAPLQHRAVAGGDLRRLAERFRAVYDAIIALVDSLADPGAASANDLIGKFDALLAAFAACETTLNTACETTLNTAIRQYPFDRVRAAAEHVKALTEARPRRPPAAASPVLASLCADDRPEIKRRFAAAVDAARALKLKIDPNSPRRQEEKRRLAESDFMDVWFLQIRTDERIDVLANLHERECDAIMDYYEGELAKLGA